MKIRQDRNADDQLDSILEVLKKNEPRLQDTEEIPQKVMQSIRNLGQRKSPGGSTGSPKIRYLTYAQRLLTAASVCLLILYGAEEFIVVKKLNTLEQHTASARVDPSITIARRLIKSGITLPSLKQRFQIRKELLTSQELTMINNIKETIKSIPQ